MTDRIVTVCSPSRLHFGLLSFGHCARRQYGGVGVMIQQPGLRLRVVGQRCFEMEGPLSGRVKEFANRWSTSCNHGQLPACRITVEFSSPQHVGLGTGTQLGLSVAAGLNAFLDQSIRSPVDLATSVGRGMRSGVGTYGFAQGGMVADRGKIGDQQIAPLDFRVDLPSAWRFVVVLPRGNIGLFGEHEQRAFQHLPPVSPETTSTLENELTARMRPAAESGQFEEFSESVYRYGMMAGTCFEQLQGGPFARKSISEFVDWTRRIGVRGVGQSSWGPAVFAILPSAEQAESYANQAREYLGAELSDLIISPINNTGADIRVFDSGPQHR